MCDTPYIFISRNPADLAEALNATSKDMLPPYYGESKPPELPAVDWQHPQMPFLQFVVERLQKNCLVKSEIGRKTVEWCGRLLANGNSLSTERIVSTAFHTAKQATGFDMEGDYPTHYPEELRALGEISDGAFRPTRRCQSSICFEGHRSVVVQFIAKDMLVRSVFNHFRDWADTTTLVQVVNATLASSGESKRCFTIENDGQFVDLAIADSSGWKNATKELGIPFYDDEFQFEVEHCAHLPPLEIHTEQIHDYESQHVPLKSSPDVTSQE